MPWPARICGREGSSEVSTIGRILRWLLPIGFFVWVGWHLGLIRYWVFLAIMIGWVAYVSRSVDPTLFRERFKPAGPTIDRYALRAIRATAAASLAVTLIDIDRFHWSDDVPPMVRAAGMIILIVSLALLAQSMIANRFFSTAIRLQTDRGHRVVDIGPYRYVRNPMYVAVTELIAGQGLLFGSVTVLEYGAMVWAGFFLFVVAYEEPALGEQFADEYKRYRANVRRWLPRITPWRG